MVGEMIHCVVGITEYLITNEQAVVQVVLRLVT